MKINCVKLMRVCLGMDLRGEMMDDERGVMNGESSGTKLKVYSSVLPSQLMINWACHVEQYMLSFKHRATVELLLLLLPGGKTPVNMYFIRLSLIIIWGKNLSGWLQVTNRLISLQLCFCESCWVWSTLLNLHIHVFQEHTSTSSLAPAAVQMMWNTNLSSE